MTEHYFSRQPQTPSEIREIVARVRGRELRLLTDRGVFSARGLDKGTRVLAETMEIPAGAAVLDWGAGYGPLGLLAAMLEPTAQVTLVETNERAAQLAAANAARLGLKNVEIIVGAAPEALKERDFDVILSNPPVHAGRTAVLAIIDYALAHLRPGGQLWLVIPTKKGAKRYFQDLRRLFPFAETREISGGYRVLWAAKHAVDDKAEGHRPCRPPNLRPEEGEECDARRTG